MSKNIVVITGSPRTNGNSMALVNAFIEVVKEKGHTVTRFDSAQMHINGCKACDTCYRTGKACSFDDDFNIIAPAIEMADVIIFSAPVYWYAFPTQIKAVIDKLYSLYSVGDKRGVSDKLCGLISCCAEEELSTFEGMSFAYQRTIELMGWKSVGEVLVPGVFKLGDVDGTDGIVRVREFASHI